MIKYDKYKDSGIEWLGEIPEHWEVNRLKDEVILLTGFPFKSSKYTDKGIKLVRGINVKEGVLNWKDTKHWNDFQPYLDKYYLEENDVLIQMDGSKVGKNFCIISSNDLPLLLLQRVARLRTKKRLNPKYLFYTLVSSNFLYWVTITKTDPLVPHIAPKDINNYIIPLQPYGEQTAIATYLDRKTKAIDQKINLLTQKTAKYKELRKALINQTVTKGLDKTVKLKDSGIEWIGEIPVHWEVRRLKSLGNIETSSVNKKIEEGEDIVRLVNYTDVYGNQNKEIWNSNLFMKVSAKPLQIISKSLIQGDVLFTPSSETIEDIGVSAVIMENLNNTLYSYHTLRLRFTKKTHLNFKKYIFNNDFVQGYLSKMATGTTRKILGLRAFNSLPIVLPDCIKEQTAIAHYLDEKTGKIDAIVSNIAQQINTLKELRKTLINDVVTGKIRVSG